MFLKVAAMAVNIKKLGSCKVTNLSTNAEVIVNSFWAVRFTLSRMLINIRQFSLDN